MVYLTRVVRLSKEVLDYLESKRVHPRESMDDLVRKLIDGDVYE